MDTSPRQAPTTSAGRVRSRRGFGVVVATLFATAFVLAACERTPSRTPAPTAASSKPGPGDSPVSFGYKTQWLAVHACDGESLANTLGLTGLEQVSWHAGMQQVEKQGGLFITPPVAGWTLVIGEIPSADEDAWKPTLESISRRFGTVYYFGTHRVSEYHAWARADNGALIRAFAYLGESGQTLVDVGPRTPEELALGIGDASKKAPDEESVLDLAGKWAIDPRTLNSQPPAKLPGWHGTKR